MTTRSTTVRHGAWTEAVSLLRTAWRFFARHYPVVLAFGALASAQRFLAVSGQEWAGGPAGELFTAVVRLAFVAWLVRTVLRAWQVRWDGARWSAWNTRNWPAVLVTTGFLMIALLLFKVIPDAVPGVVGGVDEVTWLSWELAVKNVTVIPFTMVWMTLLVLRPFTEGDHERPASRPTAA